MFVCSCPGLAAKRPEVLPLPTATQQIQSEGGMDGLQTGMEMDSPKRPGIRRVRRRFSPIAALPQPEGQNAERSTFFMCAARLGQSESSGPSR